MGLLDLLFGRKPAPAKKSRLFLTSQGSTSFEPSDQAPQSQSRIRKDLLRLVLRDVLARTGIPSEWLTAEMVSSASPGAATASMSASWCGTGPPRLLEHGPAFQEEFTFRLLMLDPRARNGSMASPGNSACPMPRSAPPAPPASWTGKVAVTEPTERLRIKPIDVVPKPAEGRAGEPKVLDKLSQRVANMAPS
jgi:hypothetical protein